MYASSSTLANASVLASAAPPIVVGATNAATDSGTSLTFAVPTGTLVDDLLLTFVSLRSAATITGPAGWTAETAVSNGATLTQRVHRKAATSGDLTALHTVTWTGSTKAAGVLIAVRGIRLTSPIVSAAGQANASAAAIAVPGLVLTAQPILDLILVSKAHSDAHSAVSGFTVPTGGTAASGPAGATANRVSVHHRTYDLANPPTTTVAAGATAALSIGARLALGVGIVVPETLVASPGGVALSGAAATLSTTPHLLTAAPGVLQLVTLFETTLVHQTPWVVLATLGPTAATHSDTTAAPGTTYRYRVAAVNAFTETLSNEALATTVSGSTFAVTASPGALAVTGATTGATFATAQLTATRGTYTGSGVAATLPHTTPVFEVVDTLGVASSYSDFGLEPSTGYVYRIVAVGTGGETASNQVVVYTLAATLDQPVTAASGGYLGTGTLASPTLAVVVGSAAHSLTGTLATLTTVRQVLASRGASAITGTAATLMASTTLTASPGSLLLTGRAATLVRTIAGQQAVPVADVSDGAWTPSAGADLYATIDEATDEAPVDADYMRTINPVADTAVVDLSDLQTPVAGDVQILVRTRTG